MSKKRFKLSKWCGMANYSCILDGDTGVMLQGEVVDLLNNLDNECKLLKKQKNHWESEYKELQKELDLFKPVIFNDVRKGTVMLYSKEKD